MEDSTVDQNERKVDNESANEEIPSLPSREELPWEEKRRTHRRDVSLHQAFSFVTTTMLMDGNESTEDIPITDDSEWNTTKDRIETEDFESETLDSLEIEGTMARVLWDFEPEKPTDLRLKAGDIIQITCRFSNGWWEGLSNGKLGDFPCNYVLELTQDKSENIVEASNSILKEKEDDGNIQDDEKKESDIVDNVKIGFLMKRGHVRKNWKTRYFALDDVSFSYYKTPEDYYNSKKPLGTIKLKPSTELKLVREIKKANTFTVSEGVSGLLYVSAPTEEEMNVWMTAISRNRDKLCHG